MLVGGEDSQDFKLQESESGPCLQPHSDLLAEFHLQEPLTFRGFFSIPEQESPEFSLFPLKFAA